jgi:hypothetical protein
MATLSDCYIPSREPGKTWRIHYSKPWQGRPGSITANLGKRQDDMFIPCGQISRVVPPFGYRATKSRIGDAVETLLGHMANEGYITNDVASEQASFIWLFIR